MSVLSLLPRISKTSYALIFDIGSASVGVAIARYHKDAAIEVLFTHRALIEYDSNHDAASLGSYVGAAIEEAGSAAIDALGTMSESKGTYSVHAIVHAPWADSQSQRAEGVLQEETEVTRDLLQQFMQRHLPKTEKGERLQFDNHVTQIELNGYSTTQPYKKKAKNIAVTVLKSSMSKEIHTTILSSFARVLPNHDVHIDAFLFAVTQLKELFEENDSFTIIDVGGEYTSVSIVHEGTVSGNSWATFGSEYLIRAVSKENDEVRKNTISELAMYLDNSCTPAQCRKVETLLETSEKEWTLAFGDACTKLSKSHHLPTPTYVSVDKRYAPWFKRVIEKLDFGQFTVTGQPLEARVLSIDKAKRPLRFSDSAKRDTMLSLGILFVDK